MIYAQGKPTVEIKSRKSAGSCDEIPVLGITKSLVGCNGDVTYSWDIETEDDLTTDEATTLGVISTAVGEVTTNNFKIGSGEVGTRMYIL